MLETLHVRNLALIDEEEIDFSNGLNILSGETGAGKSIILGALNLALGDKANKDVLRDEDSECMSTAVFSVNNPSVEAILKSIDVEVIDNQVILSRKISMTKSVAKINGETVPANKLKEAGHILLDIYGQNEHQSLSNKRKHLELLDEFAKSELLESKAKLSVCYKAYKKALDSFNEANALSSDKSSIMSLLEYEINEIESANLRINEDDELEEEFKALSSYEKTNEALGQALSVIYESALADSVDRAVVALKSVADNSKELENLYSQALDAESVISDFVMELKNVADNQSFDEERYSLVSNRLTEINRLKKKYGSTIASILDALEEKRNKYEELKNYEDYLIKIKNELDRATAELTIISEEVSSIRKKMAVSLSKSIADAMKELNFLEANFDVKFEKTADYTNKGIDDIEFMVCTNPGEPLRALKDVASGGEMSRIMLAIKTVMASIDDIDTLIFDEIDAGISGRTAAAVAKRLALVSREHQVICITHLPQIAAMADSHYLIEKNVIDSRTVSGITKLADNSSLEELARMLSGSTITETVLESAKELKLNANKVKAEIL